jgi:hypothetical protein
VSAGASSKGVVLLSRGGLFSSVGTALDLTEGTGSSAPTLLQRSPSPPGFGWTFVLGTLHMVVSGDLDRRSVYPVGFGALETSTAYGFVL